MRPPQSDQEPSGSKLGARYIVREIEVEDVARSDRQMVSTGSAHLSLSGQCLRTCRISWGAHDRSTSKTPPFRLCRLVWQRAEADSCQQQRDICAGSSLKSCQQTWGSAKGRAADEHCWKIED
jgi:hypothetical protein